MASKIKKVLSAIIVAAIMFAFVATVPTVAETSVTVTTFAELQAQVAAFSTATGNMTILIGADIELTSSLNINMHGVTKHNHSLTIKSAPGPTRVLKRSDTSVNGFFAISDGNVFFENIIIDGNKQNPPSGGSSLPVTVSGSDTTVTMNDGAIVQNVIGNHQSVIQISLYATFVLNGGKIINNDSRAVAVITNQFSFDATFIMHDGEISGNTNGNPETYGTIQQSSGVYSSGTFIMNGGKIINNNTFDNGTGTNEGSGVVIRSGRFEMYGGEISGNTITYDKSNFRQSCAGLHILTYAEEVIIGGTAKIINNFGFNGAASNVFVNENKYIKLGTGQNVPKAGMEVGVTKALNNFGIMYNNGVFVQSGATGSDVQWFFSDVPTLRV
ncbi:MAG: hypothetical protein FWE60_00145, partial [Oscillospiraceae bacterium]|nr:hypothetical protein [Oscillospiraceae bacterium]